MPRTLTTGRSTGRPTGHRRRSRQSPADPPSEPGTGYALPPGQLPQVAEPKLTAEDEVAALRGSDGLTGIEREALAHRYDVVVRGSLAKFGSDPALRAYLAATAPAVLVEASPYDRVWGIGLPGDDPRAPDPRAWRGLNMLGFALTEARRQLTGS